MTTKVKSLKYKKLSTSPTSYSPRSRLTYLRMNLKLSNHPKLMKTSRKALKSRAPYADLLPKQKTVLLKRLIETYLTPKKMQQSRPNSRRNQHCDSAKNLPNSSLKLPEKSAMMMTQSSNIMTQAVRIVTRPKLKLWNQDNRMWSSFRTPKLRLNSSESKRNTRRGGWWLRLPT